jgi:hypothetical protein
MTDRDKKRFAVAMNWLAERMAKDGEPTELTKDQLKDYYFALKNLAVSSIENAVRTYFANSTFKAFPLPGEIRKAITVEPEEHKLLPQEYVPVLSPEILKEYKKDVEATRKIIESDEPIENKVKAMLTMDRAYPGFGWGEGLEQWEQDCRNRLQQNDERYERIKRERHEGTFGAS